jgi:hypothetical protein
MTMTLDKIPIPNSISRFQQDLKPDSQPDPWQDPEHDPDSRNQKPDPFPNQILTWTQTPIRTTALTQTKDHDFVFLFDLESKGKS